MWHSSLFQLWVSGIIFAVIHSLLAAQSLKSCVYRVGVKASQYRLIYVAIATLLTLIWFVYLHGLEDRTLFSVGYPMRWINYFLQAAACGLFFLSLRPIDIGVFLGIKSMPSGGEGFIEQGIYKYQRHPMYAAVMLFIFSSPDQSINSLNLYVLFSLYFIIGSKFEERRLMKAHPAYATYKKRVAAFIPKSVFLR